MKTTQNRIYEGIPIGVAARKSIKKERIFRVRPGNGAYGAVLGEVYQDQYAYVLPTGYATANVGPARNAFIIAVSNWQGFTPTQKEVYNHRAESQNLHMSGFNLYIGEYVRATV